MENKKYLVLKEGDLHLWVNAMLVNNVPVSYQGFHTNGGEFNITPFSERYLLQLEEDASQLNNGAELTKKITNEK